MRTKLSCSLLLLGLIFSNQAPAHAAKAALLIGIQTYRYASIPTLSSSRQDVDKVKSLLIHHYGFQAKHIITLKDHEATKKKIVEGLKWLATAAGPNEQAVFYYSGHGSQIKDDNKDEADGLDETLVPYNAGTSPTSYIRDDQIGALIKTFRSKKITVIFDSCHSATGIRAFSRMRRKFWLSRTVRMYKESLRRQRAKNKRNTPTYKPINGFSKLAAGKHIAFLSAAPADGLAVDVGGKVGSLFTAYLLYSVSQKPKSSLAARIEWMKHQAIGKWPFHPEATGATSAPLFFAHPSRGKYTKRSFMGHLSKRSLNKGLPSSLSRCTKAKFCAHFRLLDGNRLDTVEFPNGSEIMFAVQLSHQAYFSIVSATPTGAGVAHPKQRGGPKGLVAKLSLSRLLRQWFVLPTFGTSSQNGFRISGVIGAKERAILYVSLQPQPLQQVVGFINQHGRLPKQSPGVLKLAITYHIISPHPTSRTSTP